jgi:adenosylcobinamide-phosphate synthase
MDLIILLIGALVFDLALGEPPAAVHPVVWMGKIIRLWEKAGLDRKPVFQFIFGLICTILTVAVFAVPAYFLMKYLKSWNFAAYIVVGIVLFKTTFSLKELRRAGQRVKVLLLDNNLGQARFGLRSLVKRDTRDLPEPLVVSAAVESVTENTSDSFVAPLFYFLILGIPGALAYRVINTLDAMIGIHGRYEYLGKFAARLDDAANYIPSRLTGLLLVLAAFIARKNVRRSWKIMLRDHAKTASPNAGWPMSAAAGALDVRLTKTGHYQLGDEQTLLEPKTIDSALQLVFLSSLSWAIICCVWEVIRFAFTTPA